MLKYSILSLQKQMYVAKWVKYGRMFNAYKMNTVLQIDMFDKDKHLHNNEELNINYCLVTWSQV